MIHDNYFVWVNVPAKYYPGNKPNRNNSTDEFVEAGNTIIKEQDKVINNIIKVFKKI
jgi:hypothetical protein